MFLMVFHDCGAYESGKVAISQDDRDTPVAALEYELNAAKEYLQTMTEALESSNDELKLANEELKTSREELQSANEELKTVNAKLAAKVEELRQSNHDLQNLLESTQIATLFLDRTLHIRRFTSTTKELFNLTDSDIGRPITEIVPRIELPGIEGIVKEVLNLQHPSETKVQVKGEDRTFSMRVLPYRGFDGAVDGVVATFVQITDLIHAQAAAERRAAQQDFLAILSGAILRGQPASALMETAPQRMAILLNAHYSKILKTLPDGENFELVARFGFRESEGTLVTGGTSQAGYTLKVREPVIVEDLREERRFTTPKLLTDNGIRSGISTIIAGPDGNWGVLGVHSEVVRSFSADDIKFIQAVANVISTGLQREDALCALHESEERLAAALRAGKLGVHDFDPRTGLVKWDHTMRELWGVEDDAVIDYAVFMAGVHPDDRAVVQAAVNDALNPDAAGSYNAVFRLINAKDHAVRWIRADGDVTFEKGIPVRLVGTVTDITERRRIEQHVQLLMREVNHRAKNLLAVVQSIARQTAKNSPPSEFADDLGYRLQGLAASQDLIIGGDWRWVSMEDLILSQISHLGETRNARIVISGDDVRLTTAAAQGIGLALHELATNAVKYGALCNEQGSVAIHWRNADDGRFLLSWTESGGPPVQPPERCGFGSTVIERMAAAAVSGSVELKFDPDGLKWRLTAPAKEVVYATDEIEQGNKSEFMFAVQDEEWAPTS